MGDIVIDNRGYDDEDMYSDQSMCSSVISNDVNKSNADDVDDKQEITADVWHQTYKKWILKAKKRKIRRAKSKNNTIDSSNSFGSSSDSTGSSISSGGSRTSIATLKQNRMYMIVLHFFLTYPKWSLSIFVILTNVSTPIPIFETQVMMPWNTLRSIVVHEQQRYVDCIQHSNKWQNQTLKEVTVQEMRRVETVQHQQLQYVMQRTNTTAECTESLYTAQQLVQDWEIRQGIDIPTTSHGSSYQQQGVCTDEDNEELELILSSHHQNWTLHKNDVEGIVQEQMQESLDQLYRVVQYTQDRSSYDYEYFVGLKLQALSTAIHTFTLPAIVIAFPNANVEMSVLLELRSIVNDFVSALELSYGHISDLQFQLKAYTISIRQFYSNYDVLLKRFVELRTFVTDLNLPGVSLPNEIDFNGLSDLLLPLDLLPDNFDLQRIGDFDVELDDLLLQLPDIDQMVALYMEESVTLMLQVVQHMAEDVTAQTQIAMQALMDVLYDIISLEDYDPPRYQSSDIETDAKDDESSNILATAMNVGNRTLSAVSEALQQLQYSSGSFFNGELDEETEDFTTTQTSGNIDFNSNSYDERNEYSQWTIPDYTFPDWIMITAQFFISNAFLIECTTQAVRLYRLKCKYEKEGIPQLPAIDNTVHDSQKAYAARQQEQSSVNAENRYMAMQLRVLKLVVLNPWVIASLLMLILVAIPVLFVWFPHVKFTCLQSREGTALAHAIWAPSNINRANGPGHALYGTGQQQCYQQQRSLCSQYVLASEITSQSTTLAIGTLQQQSDQTSAVAGVLNRCIDTDVVDASQTLHCCGIEGYTNTTVQNPCSEDQVRDFCPIDERSDPSGAFQLLSHLINTGACVDNAEEMAKDEILVNEDDNIFDCTVMEEACTIMSCDSASEGYILDMTIEADCSAQLYLIRVCLFWFMVLYHATAVYTINDLFFKGLVCVQWKRLNPHGVRLTSNVTVSGRIVEHDGAATGSRVGQMQRAKHVQQVLHRYERVGYVQLGVSVMLLVIWQISFWYIHAYYHDQFQL